jgi:hypothetical protein
MPIPDRRTNEPHRKTRKRLIDGPDSKNQGICSSKNLSNLRFYLRELKKRLKLLHSELKTAIVDSLLKIEAGYFFKNRGFSVWH